jgi:hypothetical protein
VRAGEKSIKIASALYDGSSPFYYRIFIFLIFKMELVAIDYKAAV